MDWLERELRQALERKDPPPGFAGRVARAARLDNAAPKGRVVRMPLRWLPLRWLPAAAAVLLIAGGAAYREHRGQLAKQRVMLAVRITAGQLNHIQARLREAKP